MPLPGRHASALVLGMLAVLAGLLATLAIVDPFHLRHARWFSSALVFLTLLLLTAALVAATRRWLRWVVLGVGTLALLGWTALVWFAAGLTASLTDVTTVADGDRRLVVVEGGAFAIDPRYAVVVRQGSGVLEQQSLVYQGIEEGTPPAEVRWVDPRTVLVRTGGCEYRSEVTDVTLDVDPPHRPLRIGAC